MKRSKIVLKSVVESRADASGKLGSAGDAVLIQRGIPRWLLLKCPCGCGQEIPINLDSRAGKAWRIYQSKKSGVTLYPSVWLDVGCESHFIVWRNQIYLFGRGYEDFLSLGTGVDKDDFAQRVLKAWPIGKLVHYPDVADALGEIPWDVLQACRYLKRAGLLIEGLEQQRGMFQRCENSK